MLSERDLATDDQRPSWARQLKSLSIILEGEFGVPFRFYEAETGVAMDGKGRDEEPMLAGLLAARLVAEGGPLVHPLVGGRYQLALPFPDADRPTSIAVGVIRGLARTPAAVVREQERLGKWLRAVYDRLRIASQAPGRSHHAHGNGNGSGNGSGSDRNPLSLVGLEALMGLEHLLRTQRIEKDPERNRRQVLQAAAAVLRARNLLWIPAEGDETTIEGEPLLSPWDGGQLARLLLQDPDVAKAGYLINNRVRMNSWGARFPQVVSLLAVPVPSKKGTNWVVALNKMSAPTSTTHPYELQGRTGMPGSRRGSSGPGMAGAASFRRTDAALLLPMAALLGVQLRASRRHQQVKGLLLGLSRSLAAAADARDIFIPGHGERVARISVEIGRELGLRNDELSDLYLGGLLHDVGKIGISDSILRKRDPLAPEEIAHLRQHVTIGHSLLAALRPFAHLLPAVLHHHERYDGTGYPDGLKGDAIPFLARILAVAESYDEMTSREPDHDPSAMAPEQAEEILSKGASLQWDGRVIAAFFRCRDRIRDVGPAGTDESLRDALDAALRHADGDSDRQGEAV